MNSTTCDIGSHHSPNVIAATPLPFDATAIAATAAVADECTEYVCELEVFAAKGSGVVCWNNKNE